MPNLGMGELVVILLIVVIIFGATKLPQLGRGLGEGIRNFRVGLKGDDSQSDDGDDSHGEETRTS